MKIFILIILFTLYLGLRVRSRNDINDIDSYLVDRNDRVIDNFLNKEKYLELYEYTEEQDILISNHIVKDDWRFYINIFTDEIFSGILSSDTDCILEIDDYEKIINVRFRKDKYNHKDLVNSLKEILL